MTALRAGAATADITPPVGIAHGNWGAQTHERAAGVDLLLRTTVLALGEEADPVVIADIDVGNLTYEDTKRTREAVSELVDVPTTNVRLSFSHTHSGPTYRRETWIDDGTEMVEPYLESLPHRIAGAAMEAVESMEPVHLAAGSGESIIAINRRFERPEDGRMIVGRNPDGPVDHEVGVLRFDTVDGEPLAAVANYACHPITVGPDNDLITPDFPGPMRRVVEESTGATCLFLQGAGGDVGPIRGVAKGGIDEYKPLGRRLGHEVARVWWRLEPHGREERYVERLESGAPLAVYEYDTGEPSGPLRTATRELTLPLREFDPVEELEAEYQRCLDRLDRLKSTGASAEELEREQVAAKRTAMHRNQAEAYGDQSTTTFELQVFAIGTEVAMIAMPGEPFVGIGKRIKTDSPFETTIFSGFSNAGTGYVPTPDAYGSGRFEVEITPFTSEAADVIIEEALDCLRGLV